jgi:hypothetical protein
MKKIMLMFLLGLLAISTASACISYPSVTLFDDMSCNKDSYAQYNGGIIRYPISTFDIEEIKEGLQEYKNYTYTCYTPNNQIGDTNHCRSCGIGPESTCQEFRAWTNENDVPFYDDWECKDEPNQDQCTLCHQIYIKTISLTNEDIVIILDFVSNGYSVIGQTQQEYQEFLKQSEEVNADTAICDEYNAVYHKNGWTGYIFSETSDKTSECKEIQSFGAEKACAGGITPSEDIISIWNDLKPTTNLSNNNSKLVDYWWIFAVVAIIGMVAVVYKKIKVN